MGEHRFHGALAGLIDRLRLRSLAGDPGDVAAGDVWWRSDRRQLRTHDGSGARDVDPWRRLLLGADVANNTVNPVDVTGLGFTPEPNKTYVVEGYLPVISAATTTGVQLGLAFPAGTTTSPFAINVPTAAAAAGAYVHGTVSDEFVAAAIATLTPKLARITALLRYGPAVGAGQVIPRLRSEVAGSAVTVQAGAVLEFQALS